MKFKLQIKGFFMPIFMLILTSSTALVHYAIKMDEKHKKSFYEQKITYQDEKKMLSNKTFYFNYNSYKVKSEDRLNILVHARHLLNHPKLQVAINGYTDHKGKIEYNFKLGMFRANALAEILIAKGVDLTRISLISYGNQLAANSVLLHQSINPEKFRKAEISYISTSKD